MFNDPSIVCSTCLSSDRKLQSVPKYSDLQISINFQLNTNTDMVCWECAAILKKIEKFRLQALKAKQILTWIHNNQPITLSTLCIETKKTFDEEITFKTEPPDDLDNDEPIYSNYDVPEEINEIHSESIKNAEIVEQNEVKAIIKVETDNSNKKTELYSKVVNHTSNKFFVKIMDEKEMLSTREMDKELSYYKNSLYKCENCILGYRHKSTYEKHLKIKHSKEAGKYTCDICKVGFVHKKHLSDHLGAHYKHYMCKLCTNSHHNLKTMMQHYTNVHDCRMYLCKMCDNEYPTWRALRYHRDTKHKERPKCDHCGRTYPNTTNLKRHLLVHANSPLVECPICHKKYREWSLKAHMKFHDETMATEDAYCAECDIQFKNVMLYKSHLKKSGRHISNDVKKHICQECGKRFTDKIFLQRHLDGVHLKKRDHVCHICCKMYNKPDSLRRHIKQTHEGVFKLKDQMCHICEKGFSNKSQLKQHLNSHTGERPFSCKLCSASFGFASALYMHNKLIHLKVKKSPVSAGP